jgi:TonB-dependent starch-binding outer membrane protein SusC
MLKLKLINCCMILLLAIPWHSKAQTGQTVSGTVLDAKNSPLPGVSIVIKGTAKGTTTDINGAFTLSVESSESILVFSFIGFAPKEVVVGNQTALKVSLDEDITSLDEIVVVGYGELKKNDLTGAVTSVETKKITQLGTVDVNQALQGKVAGVQITPQSGAPGTPARVRIRGVGTINNSDPLYVVDGYPTNNIDFISPTDIETMEVLKDASATAIYGNRGANGVILITTKKGKSGAPVFNFTAYTGVQNPWKKLDLTDASEYATLYLEAYKNDGKDVTNPSQFSAQDYAMLQYAIDSKSKGTDWQKEVTHKNASITNYNFSVNGGTDKNRYGFSATYFDQEGTIRNTQLKKLFLRFNNDYELSKVFNAGWSMSYINVHSNSYDGSQYGGVLPTAVTTSPVTPAWDVNTNNYGIAMMFSQAVNPVRIVDELKTRKRIDNKGVGNLYLEAKLLKGLTFRSNFGGEMYFNKINNYYPQFDISPSERRTLSNLYEERQQGYQWTWSNFFNYTKQFGEHNVNAMIGTEAQSVFNTNVNVTGYNLLNNPSQYDYIGAAKETNFQAGSSAGQSSLMSIFGRLNYSYAGKYLLTATVRRDASSKFVKKNRVGVFPSFSLGWNVSDEAFLQDVAWLSKLKLKAGYGLVGNQGSVSNTAIYNLIAAQQRYAVGGKVVEGRSNNRLGNPDLIWETTSMINVGTEIGLFNNKINLAVDYFDKKTSDMIVNPPMPVYVGALAPSVNAGDMRNKGVEFSIGYNNGEKVFKYDLSANMTFIKNEVVSLGPGVPISDGNIAGIGNTTRTEKGQVLAYFYGRKTEGLFQSTEEVNAYTWTDPNTGTKKLIQPNAKPGDVKFIDVNNDGTISDLDRVKLGSALPDFTFGFNAFFQYKNFDLKMFFLGSYGNETVNGLSGWLEGSRGLYNSYATRMDRWTPENTNTSEPRMTAANTNGNDVFSDRHVENGSYLRLRNIQLGYNIPQSLLNKIKLRALRLYVSSDNLFTITKYTGFEPEVGDYTNGQSNPFFWGVDLATYPQARTVIGGINVTF